MGQLGGSADTRFLEWISVLPGIFWVFTQKICSGSGQHRGVNKYHMVRSAEMFGHLDQNAHKKVLLTMLTRQRRSIE